MEDELRTKIEKIVNQSEIKESIEDIVSEIFKFNGNFEISIKSIDGKTSVLKIEGKRLAVINGLINLLYRMIKKNYINFEELDIIYEILKEEND